LILGENVKARHFLEKGKEASIKYEKMSPLSGLYLLEGKILLEENNIEAYHKIAKDSMKFCTEKNLLTDKQVWLKDLQNIFEEAKDFENAYLTTKEIIHNSEELKYQHKEFNISQILVNKEEEILQLENKNKITQQQKDELKQFAYIVTHDLKTPLSNISKFAGLFKKKYVHQIDEKGEEYLEYVTDSAKQLYTMLSALFQYISIEKNDTEAFERCQIEGVIKGILKKNLLKPSNYKLNLNSICAAPIRSFHLGIIMENLIRNAIKFKKEDKELFLEISVVKNKNEFLFTIADNGIGIDDQYKTQIFEIFKRLNKNNSIGTGIGLSVCKKIVQNYFGNIWVEDNDMNGTSFCFTISNSEI